MAIPSDIREREYDKFTEANDGSTAVRTVVDQIDGTLRPAGLDLGGLITTITLDDTAWVAMPTTPLAERKNIAIQNQSGNGNKVLFNYSNTAPATEGWYIEDGGFKSVLLDNNVTVYCRMLTGSGKVVVDEVA